MSRQSTKTRPEEWEKQHGSAGADSLNPSDSQYHQKFDHDPQKAAELAALEGSMNAEYQGKNGSKVSSLRESEQTPTVAPQVANSQNMSRSERQSNRRFNRETIANVLTGKRLRKSSAVITIGMLLFGGGSFLAIFFSPSLAIIQMKEVFTKSLNDQLHVLDERSSVLIRSKLKETTKGSCGAIKIHCRFATMSVNQVQKYKAAGIDIELDMQKGFGGKRGQITKISYIDDSGVTVIKTADELQRALIDNPRFRAAMARAHNPLFMGLSDKVALKVLHASKASKRLVATGDTDEERQKNVNDMVSGVEDPNAKSIVATTDDDGKTIYSDGAGNEYTAEEVKQLEEQAARGEAHAKNGGMKALFGSAIRGVNAIGAADSACMVWNSARFASALAKVKKQQQAIRFALAMVLTPADSIKAGDAKPEDVEFIGNKLTETRPQGKVLDESKLDQPGTADNPPLIDDPDAGKNALNSPGYELAAYDTVPDMNLRASKFMLSAGSVGIMEGIITMVAKIVNGGNPDPKAVSQKCRYVQNPAVRFGGLAVGVIAGIGSFGLLTIASVAGSTMISLALPYIEAHIADILAGNLFKDLSDVDIGDAAYVGSAGLFGSIAQARGLDVLNKEEATEYLAANRNTYAEYAETQSYLARSAPFDIHNRFSFLGSIAYTLVPIVQRSKASASTAMMNIASLIPSSFASLIGTAKALPADYFDHCVDPTYKRMGIVAGPFCELRYGLDKQSLAMDPLQNAVWMVESGNLANTEEAEPVDNGKPWNYVKFLRECVNRTVGYGENQDENQGDGSNCFKPEHEDLNRHFRVYTVDRSIDESMDGVDPVTASFQETDFDDGQTGNVNADGWAFPTVPTDTIIRGFRTNLDPYHMGVAIAADNDLATKGQPIFAAYDGTVIAAGPAQGLGNRIVIEHHIDGKAMTTVYARMNDDGIIRFTPGTKVKAGQQLGHIGNANMPDEKPYLYFELWNGNALGNGVRIDPQPYIDAARKKAEARNV